MHMLAFQRGLQVVLEKKQFIFILHYPLGINLHHVHNSFFVTGSTLELLKTIPHRHQRRANATLVSLFLHHSHHTGTSIRDPLREYRWKRKKKTSTLSVTSLRSQGTRFQGKCSHKSNFVGCICSLCSLPCTCRPILSHRNLTQGSIPLCQAQVVQSSIQIHRSAFVETVPPQLQPSISLWGLHILTQGPVLMF